ncbi:GNAT superfamily N-acetyltransferase [Devosia subaequoris]|uniref:GNAT superfamily N-acetyltransferase n=1 Tax=Devosia subaequoris TaxID=395930 RepID=A0A7W6IPL4_9HYPH|nr:GNAT family N-acetyltransferase [Devosia subaequoris]MBB4052987.1 GNAT superfamily N-acetyltransferase [Devosia subaequoris]MCP1210406.1 GNAT family N-acetyltransferase [Devosia subaequoris]
MVLALEVTDTPRAEDLDLLGTSLASFNEYDVGPSERTALAVFVRDTDDRIVAGLSGYSAWGWLYVQWLWVAEGQRGGGLAGRLLEAAEDEARARGCHGAYIDTFNPKALRTYQRAGYTVFGTLPDFPKGRTRSFLSKLL